MRMEFEVPRPKVVDIRNENVVLHYNRHMSAQMHALIVQMPESGWLLDETGQPCDIYDEYRHLTLEKDLLAARAKFQRVSANFKRFCRGA